MGLLGTLVTLPLAPARGVVRIAELLEREARRQLDDPARLRRRLAELDDALRAGEITADEYDQLRDELLLRLVSRSAP